MNILGAVVFISILYNILPFIDGFVDGAGLLLTWLFKKIVRFGIYYLMCLTYIIWFIMMSNFISKLANSWYFGTKFNFDESDFVLVRQDILTKYLHVSIENNYTEF